MPYDVERPPLRVRPGISWRLGVFAAAMHGFALVAVYMLPMTVVQRGATAAVVMLGLVYGLAGRVLHRLPWSLREAVWRPDGGWSLILASGYELEGRLLASTYVSPLLVVLRFRCGRLRTCSLVLLPDNLQPDQLRRLRTRLRLVGAEGPDGSKVGA